MTGHHRRMITFLLMWACAPEPDGPASGTDDTASLVDSAGWWEADAEPEPPPPAEDCAAAEAAEDAGTEDWGAIDGEASRYTSMWLTPVGDADAVTVTVTDGLFDIFDIEAFVYQAPPDVDVAIELRWVADTDGVDRGVVATANDNGPGALEQLNWAGTAFSDDSGTYEIVVRAVSGSACDVPVWVQVLLGGW